MNCLTSLHLTPITKHFPSTSMLDNRNLTTCYIRKYIHSGGVVVAGSNPAVPTILHHQFQWHFNRNQQATFIMIV